MEYSKREYMAAAAKIEAMVKEGKVSKEDAEKRLGQMRKRMFPSKDGAKDRAKDGLKDGAKDSKRAKGKTKGDARRKDDDVMQAKKNRYMKFAEGVEADLKARKISPEQAEEKLIEMRMKMFDNDRK